MCTLADASNAPCISWYPQELSEVTSGKVLLGDSPTTLLDSNLSNRENHNTCGPTLECKDWSLQLLMSVQWTARPGDITASSSGSKEDVKCLLREWKAEQVGLFCWSSFATCSWDCGCTMRWAWSAKKLLKRFCQP